MENKETKTKDSAKMSCGESQNREWGCQEKWWEKKKKKVNLGRQSVGVDACHAWCIWSKTTTQSNSWREKKILLESLTWLGIFQNMIEGTQALQNQGEDFIHLKLWKCDIETKTNYTILSQGAFLWSTWKIKPYSCYNLSEPFGIVGWSMVVCFSSSSLI